MEDFFILDIPEFAPEYKKTEKYGYRNAEEKNRLKAVLEESTNGYCMYCYSRIRVDGKLFGNLEHAIEKGNSEKLMDCVPDIGLSCSVCNQIFKRIGEKKRKVSKHASDDFETNSRCSVKKAKQCTVPCKALRELQKHYSSLPGAEIILQPMGVQGKDTKQNLALQYNIMKMEFEPAEHKYTYSEQECLFMKKHIHRFRLNDSQYRSRQLFDFVRNIIDNNGKIPVYEYNNLTADLFRQKLSGKTREEVLKICRSIYIIAFTKV